MRLTSYLTTTFAAALLSGCGVAGDFCTVAKPDIYASEGVVDYLLDNDPNHLRADMVENQYGVKHCGWGSVVPYVGD